MSDKHLHRPSEADGSNQPGNGGEDINQSARYSLSNSIDQFQQQNPAQGFSSSEYSNSRYTSPFSDNSGGGGSVVERVVGVRQGYSQGGGQNQVQPPNNAHQRQTTNFRSNFRHQYLSQPPPQDHRRQYQFHQMNNHVASELLSAANNDNVNSRQQLNNPSLPYASTAATDYDLHLIANEMKNVYESDNHSTFDQFHQAQMQGTDHDTRYPSPQPINPYLQQQQLVQHDQQQPAQTQPQQQQPRGNNTLEEGQTDDKSGSDGGSPGRSKAISKPERPVTKSATGQFVCEWGNCTEEIKTFTRKCEWSKHMDKHDRPYKCQANGCEKLPGFTYSGGLLRHEREVHNKHGGPRKHLNCPHVNCKRHGGKGFSRQENLNEHLRRVHTAPTANGNPPNGTEPESVANAEPAQEPDIEAQQLRAQLSTELGQVQAQGQGQKRKRVHSNDNVDDDIRGEIKRLQQENHELREELHRTKTDQEAIQADMQRQLHHLQAAIHMQTQPRMQQSQPRVQQAPPANMV